MVVLSLIVVFVFSCVSLTVNLTAESTRRHSKINNGDSENSKIINNETIESDSLLLFLTYTDRQYLKSWGWVEPKMVRYVEGKTIAHRVYGYACTLNRRNYQDQKYQDQDRRDSHRGVYALNW